MQDDNKRRPSEELNMYLQFDLVLSDISAFLVDGDYNWSQASLRKSADSGKSNGVSFLPVIDKCGVIVRLQQVKMWMLPLWVITFYWCRLVYMHLYMLCAWFSSITCMIVVVDYLLS